MLPDEFDIAHCFGVLQGIENPHLLGSFSFSPEADEYFHYKTSNVVGPFPSSYHLAALKWEDGGQF